jgi:hypothetical protein
VCGAAMKWVTREAGTTEEAERAGEEWRREEGARVVRHQRNRRTDVLLYTYLPQSPSSQQELYNINAATEQEGLLCAYPS